jgi:hypothetical protein
MRFAPAAAFCVMLVAACGGPDDGVQTGVSKTTNWFSDDAANARPAVDGSGRPTSDAAFSGDADLADGAATSSIDADGGASDDAHVVDTAAPDTGPPPPEQCGNFIDDNGNGNIDEWCFPLPVLRTGQQWSDFGIRQIVAGDAVGQKINFTMNAGDRLIVLARNIDKQPTVVVADWLKAPDAKVWLGDVAWSQSAGRGYGGVDAGTIVVGNSDKHPVPTGTWEVGFRRTNGITIAGPQAPSAGWLHIGVQRSTTTAATMKLDFDVYVVGEQPLPVDTLAKSIFWAKVVARFNEIWAPAGLGVGEVSFTAIVGDQAKKFRHVDNIGAPDDSNELPAMFKLAGKLKPKSNRVALFLVATLNDDGQPVAKGVTGQIGGVSGAIGQRFGAIAMATDAVDVAKFMKADSSGAAAGLEYGHVWAHEVGHFLGLWHTTEGNATLHDPIADTAECELPKGQLIITPAECPSAAKNLMFPHAGDTALSSGQIAASRRHPWPN